MTALYWCWQADDWTVLMSWWVDKLMTALCWWVDELIGWRVDVLTGWWVDGKMGTWVEGKMGTWVDGLMALMGWWVDGLMGWWVDGLMGWWVDGLMGWWVEVDGLMGWWVDGLMGWWVDGLMGWWVDGLMGWWVDHSRNKIELHLNCMFESVIISSICWSNLCSCQWTKSTSGGKPMFNSWTFISVRISNENHRIIHQFVCNRTHKCLRNLIISDFVSHFNSLKNSKNSNYFGQNN